MTALSRIELGFERLGYGGDRRLHAYAFADVLSSTGEAREVPLAVFTQLPESFRSAAFGVISEASDPGAEIMARRALGAPVFLSIDPAGGVGVWAVQARNPPRLLERVSLEGIEALFARHAEDWSPRALHRAKVQGGAHDAYQLDFVDLGLMPAIEGEVQIKLHRVLTEVVELLGSPDASPEAQRTAFRMTFRLLAAKILSDRHHPEAAAWRGRDVNSVLAGIAEYYHLSALERSAVQDGGKVAVAWAVLLGAVNLRNISSDSLAFVYENTLVTADTRKMFGTHSTPRVVAEYMLAALDLGRHDLETLRVVEPFAGAGVFLVAALRQMRDLLPADWRADQRHAFLTARLSGAELDAFACEVATLSLILADYPNANGWKIQPRDLFEAGALATTLAGATVVLCNPPFEDFDQTERLAYPAAFARSPSRGIFALETALDARPEALGFVMPRGVLLQKQYAKVRARLGMTYEDIELVSLPDRVFEKATAPSALIIARGLKNRPATAVRLQSKEVKDAEREAFLRTGVLAAGRAQLRQVPGDQLWVGELDAVWSYVDAAPRLGSHSAIHRGLQWRSQRDGVALRPGPYARPGLFKPAESLIPFAVRASLLLNFNPAAALYPGPLTRPWSDPKVLINNQRASRGPWRLVGAFDETGLAASQQFSALWPSGAYSGRALCAVVNGPLANAYVTERTTDHDFTNAMLATLPLPDRLDHQALEAAVMAYEGALSEEYTFLHVPDEERLNRLLLAIDAIVLQGYDLPPRLERQLLDAFSGHTRPVKHTFPGWFPADFRGFMPLHEWLAGTYSSNIGGWPTKVFRPLPQAEAEVLARFVR